ncbi:MAG: glucose/arabinose dehydrogenase [Glaciecola sp.]|jgi:glucose/arabinose dehydrogenase
MAHRIGRLLVVALALSGCSSQNSTNASGLVQPSPTAGQPSDSSELSYTADDASSTENLPVSSGPVSLAYEIFAEGLQSPVLALPRPGTDQVWVLEQRGRIVSVTSSGGRDEIADLTNLVDFGGEKGLLGLAFAPDHEQSGHFVLHYSAGDADGATRVERWSLAAPSGAAMRGSLVLEVDQPAANHNGGMLQFGPDGMLYVALGDGGGGGDTFGNGQRPDTLLGTILRLDLSSEPYEVPPDNPFVSGQTPDGLQAAPEVWVYGLRNPWRTWIDGQAIYIGDVGQDRIEEVDVIGLDQGGANFGWPIREGTECFRDADCRSQSLVAPVAQYDHSGGACSITGGVVNRGPAAPDLDGHYFYSDFCAGFLRSFRLGPDGAATDAADWSEQVGIPTQVLSFGRDTQGNVLVLGADGTIRRIVQI